MNNDIQTNLKLKILYVTANSEDSGLFEHFLGNAGVNAEVKTVDCFDDFKSEILKYVTDAVLAEFDLPRWNGLTAVDWLRQNNNELPFFFYSSAIGEEQVADCLRHGATNFILKGNFPRLIQSLNDSIYTSTTTSEGSQKPEPNAAAPNYPNTLHIRQTLEGALHAIMILVEQRDPYTTGHSQRVSNLSVAIARKMKLPEKQVEDLRLAAQMHDVGKASLPAEILSKPAELSAPEKKIIRMHPILGANILRPLSFSSNLARIVEQHHEKLDGSGYPKGLKGDEISIEARIIGVADLVDSISTHRPYRPAKRLSEALADLKQQSGIKYDPKVIDALLELVEEGYFTFNP